MSTAAKSDMSSRVKSMRENTKETQDDTPLVVHNPVDDENAPPDRGEQFGPHRRGMPAAPTTHNVLWTVGCVKLYETSPFDACVSLKVFLFMPFAS